MLYFHSIDPVNPLSHRPNQFRKIIEVIKVSKRECVTIAELGNRLRNDQDVEQCVAISFDDGYSNNFETALPILLEAGLRATFFITAGLVGEGNHHFKRQNFTLYSDLQGMSRSQLLELQDLGMEIAGHTWSHCDCSRADTQTIHLELRKSKSFLEDLLGSPVTSFAYPHGNTFPNAREILFKEGYLQACTSNWDCLTKETDPFFIPRLISDITDTAKDMELKLKGNADYIRYIRFISNKNYNLSGE